MRFLLVVMLTCLTTLAMAADRHVDPERGDDDRDGVEQPVRTIGRAISLAQPGDTIHLLPRVYRDWAGFFDKSGEPGQPITLDGHGATLDGCDRLDPLGWKEVEPGLYENPDLMPLTDAIVDRWFFVFDGLLNRMRRCSKGPSEPLKTPATLQPGEWTFVKDNERSLAARKGYSCGSFWIKLPAGQTLAEAKIEYPFRMAGVAMHGKCAHLVVRNVTSTRPYNDGFNLADCQDVVFENIRAIDCGDDGISAHGVCRYRVQGFQSIGNATGICDTGDSITSYRDVFIDRCIGFDLYFLDTGRYSVTNAHIRSSAVHPLYLLGREAPAGACDVTLDNVWLERVGSAAEVRVSPGTRLTARQSTFTHLDWQATGGDITLDRCVLQGMVPTEPPRPPNLHLWPDARWHGEDCRYTFDSIRIADRWFTLAQINNFREATSSDLGSQWTSDNPASEVGIGVDRTKLPQPQGFDILRITR